MAAVIHEDTVYVPVSFADGQPGKPIPLLTTAEAGLAEEV